MDCFESCCLDCLLCVCHNEKKVPDEWQAPQAIPAILQVSSSKHNAKKIATRVRGPFHQSITAILTEEKRCVCVASEFFFSRSLYLCCLVILHSSFDGNEALFSVCVLVNAVLLFSFFLFLFFRTSPILTNLKTRLVL